MRRDQLRSTRQRKKFRPSSSRSEQHWDSRRMDCNSRSRLACSQKNDLYPQAQTMRNGSKPIQTLQFRSGLLNKKQCKSASSALSAFELLHALIILVRICRRTIQIRLAPSLFRVRIAHVVRKGVAPFLESTTCSVMWQVCMNGSLSRAFMVTRATWARVKIQAVLLV